MLGGRERRVRRMARRRPRQDIRRVVRAGQLHDARRVRRRTRRRLGVPQGYIIRYGTAPDKLYTHYQVFAAQTVVVNTLMRGVDYYATIDSFNESGVTRGTETVYLPATEPLVEGYDMRGDSPSPAITNRVAGAAVHEAENAAFVGTGVRPAYEVRASGAKALHGLGPRGTSVTFRDVKGTECRRLRISYSTPFPAKIAVTVNGGAPFTVALPATRGWPTYMTQDVTLPEQRLVASNTVMVEGLGDAFSLDWIQLLR